MILFSAMTLSDVIVEGVLSKGPVIALRASKFSLFSVGLEMAGQVPRVGRTELALVALVWLLAGVAAQVALEDRP